MIISRNLNDCFYGASLGDCVSDTIIHYRYIHISLSMKGTSWIRIFIVKKNYFLRSQKRQRIYIDGNQCRMKWEFHLEKDGTFTL